MRHSVKKSFFPGDFEAAKSIKNRENNSHGSIFIMILCQRALSQKNQVQGSFGLSPKRGRGVLGDSRDALSRGRKQQKFQLT